MAAKRIYGIDLGTTYSCISYVDDTGKPVVLPSFEGDLTVPSVVYFESLENIIVGKEAKNSAKLCPDRVVEFVKRSMGVQGYSYEVDGKEHKAEEISSFILRKLVKDAAQSTNEEITDVVITCPAYFGINEREATKNAGKLAGLTVHHILNEPTAAAICYGIDKQNNEVVLIYDLGGGTFDVTVIAIKDGNIQVIVTGGDHNLGGKDWDDRITDYFIQQFMDANPASTDPRDDPYSYQEIAKLAEEAKKSLSSKEKAPFMFSHAGHRARIELTREKLEEITKPLLEQTIELTQQLLEQSKSYGYNKIDRILLVGGSSKMPCVSKRLKEAFGLDTQLYDPDLAVAKGAAMMGLKILAGEMIKEEIATVRGINKEDINLEQVDNRTLEAAAQTVAVKSAKVLRLPSKDIAKMVKSKIINVSSKGFGVVAVVDEAGEKEEVAYLIHSNTSVPCEVTETDFGTVNANQRSVYVRVMEQEGKVESPELVDNKLIGEGEITGLPPNLPAGTPIHVTFRLEEDGTLKVSALEPSSRQNLTIEIKIDGIMDEQEVEQKKGLLLKKNIS